MKIKDILKNKKIYFILLFIIIALFLVIKVPSWSTRIDSAAWDGVIATSFTSGNGTEENPFVISSASEFAYFKSLLEGEDANLYADKYYVITNSLNYGKYDISIQNEIPFTGSIDGYGNIISNATLTSSLFQELESATIKNMNFQNMKETVESNNSFLAQKVTSSNFSYLSIENTINTSATYAGLIYQDEGSTYQNIILNTVVSSGDDIYTIAYSLKDTTITNLLKKTDLYESYLQEENVTISNLKEYKVSGNKIILDDESTLSNYENDEYITEIISDEIVIINKSNAIATVDEVEDTPSFEVHESGTSNNTVYINDLDADYDYYMGKDIVETGGTLPTGESLGKYSKSNLVRVMVIYDGSDGTNTGTISLTEKENKMIYYHWYVVENNQVKITLIENPFTNRPTNMGFNGWVSSTKNVTISYEYTLNERVATVPVTKTSDGYEDVVISLHASWTKAKVSYISSNNWTSTFNNFDTKGIHEIVTTYEVCEDYDMSGYYVKKTANRGEQYTGYEYSNWNGYQWRNNASCNPRGYGTSTCTYYALVENENYDSSNTYYRYSNGYMYEVYESDLDIKCTIETDSSYIDKDMTGYYVQKNYSYGSSLAGAYNSSGEQVSGTCYSSNCSYYYLLQADSDNIYDSTVTYYYMATRDTNIAVLSGSFSGTWSSSNNKPFTFTGLYNGTQTSSYWTPNSSTTIYNDTTIENMQIRSTTSRSTSYSYSSGGTLSANYHNLRIGRGITQNGNYVNYSWIIGGSSATGSSSSNTIYKIIVESGLYNFGSLTHNASSSSYWGTDRVYVQAYGVFGSDYDRVTNNNDDLNFYFCLGGSWGGDIYSSLESGMNMVFKSGSFGTSKSDYSTGVYVGGRYGGDHYTARTTKVEGGWIYNLIGGPLTYDTRTDVNDTYIYQTGGEIDMITGGAGRSATFGNRIISLTGGKVNYSVFAGSNGYTGSDGEGTVNGTGFIYVGGTSTVGDETLVSNGSTLFGAEAGSIFGIGNGKSGSSTIGSSDNSNILITGSATILNNVYGGGNYGATGVSSTSSSSYTKITMNGGTVKGNIYGGGNQNGSGSSSKSSTITITMNGGTVEGNIYGGSNVSGTVYGDVTVNIYAGNVNGNVYGGGKGNNTFVKEEVNVKVGSTDTTTPVITGNVYGGSAYGTVNGTSSTNASGSDTFVTVDNGIITGSVFGGGEGSSSYTPYVLGNITVTINGGNISYVFGGNDKAGIPNKNVEVYLKGGTIGSVYGGGNESSVNVTNVYQENSTVTSIFGGSNLIGDVKTTNISVTGGTTGNIFGGNDQGGSVEVTNVTIDSGTITNSVYGGGNKVDTTTTNITLNGSTNKIPNVYGGGNNASVTTVYITKNDGEVENLFGGSNETGNVETVLITHKAGTTDNLFGGNNAGGNTITSTIDYLDGTSTNIYGGGNETNSDKSTINVTSGTIGSVYGGGNKSGITDTTLNLYSATITNVYGGSNESGTVTNTTINVEGTTIENLYGGNNAGGLTENPIILIENGTITNVYGGGNLAETTKTSITIQDGTIEYLYGGGNQAAITNDTLVDINGGTFKHNIYGGGNYGVVNGSSTVNITDATILGSAYAGGNGTTAVVVGNTTISIDGNTVVGSETSTAPAEGSVFGGGNAAPTGTEDNNSSVGTVNIIGGTIYGNVYGGANTAKLYGNTALNIGLNTIVSGTDVKATYDETNKNYKTSEGTLSINDSFASTTNQNYWGIFTDITNDLETSVKDFTLVLYTKDNTLTQCYNCTFEIDGDYTTIKPTIYSDNQVTIASGSTFSLNGAWTLTDPSSIKVVSYYTENITDPVTSDYKKSDIYIKGTIFGGGEANASGSENYDYKFISVTKGIEIQIDATDYEVFNTYGSIFGSGNASSASGLSTITIKNYGTREKPGTNISIQRTNILTLDNSHILLSGAKDRTNEYDKELFSLSRIDDLRITNNSTLYLENNANLLQKFQSLTSDGEIATVTIDDDTKTVTKNVDNRLYLKEGINLNIATDENVTSYGEVYGMTFFGMFTFDRDNNVNTGIYEDSFNYGDALDWGDMPTKGSYVLGLHKTNHDIEKDGFYSNFMDEDTSTNIVKYIDPTPEDSTFYMWIIGEAVVEYDVDLVASKYSTLGSVEVTFLEFSKPNTSFQILGFDDSNLAQGISLKGKNDIAKQAKTSEEANNNFALVMESSNQGWLTDGSTTFKTTDPSIDGTTYYVGDSTSVVPSLLFYLYHSKNLTEEKDMGRVSITVMAITAIDALTNETKRLIINVDLSSALFQTNEYEAAMTPGDKYSLFTSTQTNITTTSKLSAYFALYGADTNLYKTGYHRALVSSYAFPENTKITMLDIIQDNPKYYYHIITKEEEENALKEIATNGETSYNFSIFTDMGSVSADSYYDDEEKNKIYYQNGNSDEEFIFIVDFADASIDSDVLDNSLLVELRNADNQTMISVLGIEHESMKYNLYINKDSVIGLTGEVDANPLYVGNNATITVNTSYQNLSSGSNTIYDTQYFDSKMGLKITFHDKDGNVVSGNGLMGAYFEIGGVKYYPNVDGTTRIKIADKVGSVEKWIELNTENASIATGSYTIDIEAFGSPDGIYYGSTTSSHLEIPITIINSIYGLKSETSDENVVIDTKKQEGDKTLTFTLSYDSGLSNPNLRMILYRRTYNNIYDTTYEVVDLNDYVDQLLVTTNNQYEYLLTSNPSSTNEFHMRLKENVKTGTYLLKFELYDEDTFIGETKHYIIIK